MLFVSTQIFYFQISNPKKRKKKREQLVPNQVPNNELRLDICQFVCFLFFFSFKFLNDDFIIEGKKTSFEIIPRRIERLLQTKEQLEFRK